MKVSIFGLGYVGCVSAGCLSNLGHTIIGVDVSTIKVHLINQGRPTIIEEGIDQLISHAKQEERLWATTSFREAVLSTEISIISVGTPSTKNGHLNMEYIFKVAEEIGDALKEKNSFHTVAIRSTVLPGTNQKITDIISRISGKVKGQDFAVVSNPEFLREGTAVKDFYHPPYTLIGCDNNTARDMMLSLYEQIPGEKIVTDIGVAEIIKYVNNTFHALKVVFGNEVGNICKSLDIDSHKVIDIFCSDRQLNISPYYFKPGFAYGGSCLPKDTKAFKTLARDHYLEVPVIESIDKSNELHKARALDLIMAKGRKNIAVLGLSFKAGTDDLRNSPIVDIIERLLGKGYNIRIYDKNVKLSELTGTNKEYIESKIPHLQKLIYSDLDQVVEPMDVVVIANKDEEFQSMLNRTDKIIIDLVRLQKDVLYKENYAGLCW